MAPPMSSIVQPNPAGSHMATATCAREEAEKACQLADEQFLAGNIHGACRQARRAKRLCPSLPGVDNAVAAYDVHAAVGGGWRAILDLRPAADAAATPTEEAIKKQYRRLSLLVHPDKAHCAAADGAFKLLNQAYNDALAPPDSYCSDQGTGPHPPRRHDGDDDGVPRPPPQQTTTVVMMQQMMRGPYERILVYCPSCKNEFGGKIGSWEQKAGMRCACCPQWLNPPWQKKPPTKKKPSDAPGRQVFQCPALCPVCGAQYTSMVCVGQWCLQCKACSKAAMVDVQGPDLATATVRRRA